MRELKSDRPPLWRRFDHEAAIEPGEAIRPSGAEAREVLVQEATVFLG
jgi:hypothetical protein